jgi:UDP-N-acetylglucosamine acyltransferase
MSAPLIHPTAIVAGAASLADDVVVGAYSVIGPKVRLGRGTTVASHAVIEGNTVLGADNRVFQFASVGAEPQDKKYTGEDSQLILGDGNVIREFATLQPGTGVGGGITRVGNRCLLMNYSHVAHDCILGSDIIVSNGSQLGGHVTIQDFVVVGALVGIHQFAQIGESAILGAGAMVSLDVAPFCNATGDRASLHGLNLVGLKRRSFDDETIGALRSAYRLVFQSRLKIADALARVRTEVPPRPEVERFVAFLEKSERGLCRPARRKDDNS